MQGYVVVGGPGLKRCSEDAIEEHAKRARHAHTGPAVACGNQAPLGTLRPVSFAHHYLPSPLTNVVQPPTKTEIAYVYFVATDQRYAFVRALNNTEAMYVPSRSFRVHSPLVGDWVRLHLAQHGSGHVVSMYPANNEVSLPEAMFSDERRLGKVIHLRKDGTGRVRVSILADRGCVFYGSMDDVEPYGDSMCEGASVSFVPVVRRKNGSSDTRALHVHLVSTAVDVGPISTEDLLARMALKHSVHDMILSWTSCSILGSSVRRAEEGQCVVRLHVATVSDRDTVQRMIAGSYPKIASVGFTES